VCRNSSVQEVAQHHRESRLYALDVGSPVGDLVNRLGEVVGEGRLRHVDGQSPGVRDHLPWWQGTGDHVATVARAAEGL
jgi:hypothetical protein